MTEIRAYRDADAASWLQCRLLSFFGTEYYDDIVVARPLFENPAHRLVAVENDAVVGLMDVEIFTDRATIDVLAVHPDHQRSGLATQLLDAVLPRLPGGVLDAWTRGDASANAWYQRSGFTENFRYLHVYKSSQDDADGFETPEGLGKPVAAFMHAPISLEASLRSRFSRVHVCRQYVRSL
ncbi:ribosomal protein S18 acetylase RimI-like enzyme [Kribbella rubisoli]|uniref:Ribosomal protein S18 acetylase RimI-like enzyme n=1 Tax=Kribbella rubisoli TaxID=3075929 RepID=A0A4Q7XBK3_9ACTN|nr:N-acetyltransferase [Kribbella rubisoli]RZU20514.1 ribosomal protein S18 acetylase RimI-like enzyme [Kribbella rubisoli]